MADDSIAARPYAKAVFEMAGEAGALDEWSGRLAFWAALIENPEMARRLDSPKLTRHDRATMIETVIGDDELDDTSRNLIRLLAENDRLALIPSIHESYEEMRAEAEGEIEATVTSAFDLDEGQRTRLAEALGRRLNRRVRIKVEIDRDLIGGAVIRAGDLVIDGSLKGRVEKMARAVAS